MEKTARLSIPKLAGLAVLCTGACLATTIAAMPENALAVETSSTEIRVSIDDDQLSIGSPSLVPGKLQGDGNIVFPDADTICFYNDSVYKVAVKSCQLETNDNANLVPYADYSKSTETNAYYIDVSNDRFSQNIIHLTETTTNLDDSWNIASKQKLQVRFRGAMKNIADSPDLTQMDEYGFGATNICTLHWVISSTLNEAAAS